MPENKTTPVEKQQPAPCHQAGYQKDHAVRVDRPGPLRGGSNNLLRTGRSCQNPVWRSLRFPGRVLLRQDHEKAGFDRRSVLPGDRHHSCHERPCRLPDLDALHRLLCCHCHLLDVLHDHMAGDELPEGHRRCHNRCNPSGTALGWIPWNHTGFSWPDVYGQHRRRSG